ncbi:MAG: murein biosynthesis integral membrane protein MurJ [Desulfobacterales bacterium]
MTSADIKKIGIASAIMMLSVFLSRVAGLIREMVIAFVGGTHGQVDAYQVAFIIPEILNHILAGGFLSVTFIPIFSKYLVCDDEKGGWDVCVMVLNTFGGFLILLCGFAIAVSPRLIALLAPGLEDPALVESAVRMTRIIIPAQFFFFAGGLFAAVQFAKGKFGIPALAPLIYNIGIILGGLLLGRHIGMEGFSWGALAGAGLGNFLLQYWGAARIGFTYRLKIGLLHPDIKRYVLLTLPLMFGLTMTFSTEIFFKFFGSFLERGGIAALNYGLRIMLILVGLFGQAVGVASFPVLARLAVKNETSEMNRILNGTLRVLAFVIPLSVLLIVLRSEVVFLLFQRGRFDAASTELTSGILGYMLIGAFAFSAQSIVVRGFYAKQNTVLPAIYQTAAVLLSIPLYLIGMQVMALSGVALAVSLSALLQTLVLYVIWNRKSRNSGAGTVYFSVMKMIGLSIPLGLFFEWMRIRLLPMFDMDAAGGNLAVSVIVGGAFVGVLFIFGTVFNIEEIRFFYRRLRSFLSKKPGPAAGSAGKYSER